VRAVAVALPSVAGRLPWPVRLRTAAGRYVIERSGVIRLLPRVRQAGLSPPGGAWVPWPEHGWAVLRAGHLEIGRGHAILWRSARRYPAASASQFSWMLTARAGVAFQVRKSGPWYAARWGGPEHRFRLHGWLETWTRSGDLVAVVNRPGSHRFGYSVYSPRGALLARLATGLRGPQLNYSDDPVSGSFWFLAANGTLYRTDGRQVTAMGDALGFGFGGRPYVSGNYHGTIQLVSVGWRQGQVVFAGNGRLIARIPAPPHPATAAGFGDVAVSDDGAVAYALEDEGTGAGTVYLVRPGSAPVAVYRTAVGASPCAPSLWWHGTWLLYLAQQHPVLIDTTPGQRRVIRLPAALPDGGGRLVPVDPYSIRWR